MKIYLCGPINGCTDDEATTWREWFKDMTKGNIAAPFAQVQFIDPMLRDYRGKEVLNCREIVDLDKRDILNCDVMVVMFTKPSVGTSMEMMFAWERNKPILVIDESKAPLSPWLIHHSSAIVKSKEEAASKLREWIRVI